MNAVDMAPAAARDLLLEEYFAGRSQAWGVFVDRFGKLRRTFHVDIEGSLDGDVLTLTERFLYGDGKREQRVWTIRRQQSGLYEGSAHDVVGIARGRSEGKCFRWSYDLALPVGGRIWNVRFNDELWLLEDGMMINRGRMSKFGIALGEAIICFRR